MQSGHKLEQLLECLIHVIGRAAIPQEDVAKIVGTGTKQIQAFTLCDGKNSQKAIARKTGLDQASLSRTFSRWVESGVAFWIGDGKEARLLHVYAINSANRKLRKPKDRRTGRRG